jgi:hypothetical protein
VPGREQDLRQAGVDGAADQGTQHAIHTRDKQVNHSLKGIVSEDEDIRPFSEYVDI